MKRVAFAAVCAALFTFAGIAILLITQPSSEAVSFGLIGAGVVAAILSLRE